MNGIEMGIDDDVEERRLGFTDSSFADEDDFIDEEMFMLDDVIDEVLVNESLGGKEGLNVGLLNNDVQNIPGSPWAQPTARQGSPRPFEPMALAKYASTLGFVGSVLWVVAGFVVAVW